MPALIGPWVDVTSFAPSGHARDGVAVWDAYIQLAIDYIIQQSNLTSPPGDVGTLYFPPGKYRLCNPLLIRNPPTGATSYALCSIQMVGDAPPYTSSMFHESVLIADFSDKPAIIIQRGRKVRLANFAIQGQNTFTISGVDDLYGSTFLASGVTDNLPRAPYAGICIDPFCGAGQKLGGGYPDMDAYYLPTDGNGGSSDIAIEDCFIDGFVVGIMISPNGVTQNAENIAINDCYIKHAKSAIALGQNQTRSVTVRNLATGDTKYVFDCTHYGNGSGNCPSVFGANIGYTKYIFSTFSSGSGAVIDGLYCEASLSIGVLGAAGSSDGYTFNGCGFKLMSRATSPTIGYHLVNMARATFNSCQLTLELSDGSSPNPLPPLYFHNIGQTTFKDCMIARIHHGDLGGGAYDYSLPFWINDRFEAVSFENTLVNGQPNPAVLSQHTTFGTLGNVNSQWILPGTFFHEIQNVEYYPPLNTLHWVASQILKIGVHSGPGLTLNADNTISFVAPTHGMVAKGDLIRIEPGNFAGFIEEYPSTQTNPVIGKVISVSTVGGTETVTLGWVPDYVVAWLSTGPTLASTVWLYVTGLRKLHKATQATLTNGSTNITATSTTAVWVPGDRIYDKQKKLPGNAHITAVSGSTITLSMPVTAPTGTVVDVYDAAVYTFDTDQSYALTGAGGVQPRTTRTSDVVAQFDAAAGDWAWTPAASDFYYENVGAVGSKIVFPLPLRNGAVVQTVSLGIRGAQGHGSLPANMPVLKLIQKDALGVATVIASVMDTSALGAYEAPHLLTIAPSPGVPSLFTANTESYAYYLYFTAESGTGSVSGVGTGTRVYQPQVVSGW